MDGKQTWVKRLIVRRTYHWGVRLCRQLAQGKEIASLVICVIFVITQLLTTPLFLRVLRVLKHGVYGSERFLRRVIPPYLSSWSAHVLLSLCMPHSKNQQTQKKTLTKNLHHYASIAEGMRPIVVNWGARVHARVFSENGFCFLGKING